MLIISVEIRSRSPNIGRESSRCIITQFGGMMHDKLRAYYIQRSFSRMRSTIHLTDVSHLPVHGYCDVNRRGIETNTRCTSRDRKIGIMLTHSSSYGFCVLSGSSTGRTARAQAAAPRATPKHTRIVYCSHFQFQICVGINTNIADWETCEIIYNSPFFPTPSFRPTANQFPFITAQPPSGFRAMMIVTFATVHVTFRDTWYATQTNYTDRATAACRQS
jgi:hypothetical protein